MISIQDYLMGRASLNNLSEDVVANINTLIPKINDLLEKFGQPRKCNSGYRRFEDQLKINPKALNSEHCKGAAIDLEDKDGELWKWCMINMDYCVMQDFYFEDKKSTPTWIHIQIVPPHSGKRIFIP